MISSTEEKMDQRAVTRNASNAKLTVEMAMLSPSASSWNDSRIGMDANFKISQIERIRNEMEIRIENIIDEKLKQKQFINI